MTADSLSTAPEARREAEELIFRPRLLTDLLDKALERFPNRTAMDFYGRTWSYGELGELVARAARGLQDQGLRPDDRFGLCLPNCPYFIVLYFAALRAGAIVVNFNPLYTPYEMEHQIRDSGTCMMAVPDLRFIHDKAQSIPEETGLEKIVLCPMSEMLPPLRSLGFKLLKRKDHARITDEERHIRLRDLLANHAAPDPVQRSPDDIAVLQYTGGTTGLPKGAMLTHANLAANSAQMLAHFGGMPGKQQRTLGILPMFHVFALTTVLNFSIESGAELVLLPRFEMGQVLASIKRKPPTQFFAVPTIYIAFNNLPRRKLPDLSTVICCISGGAPLPLEVREQFEERTGSRVVEGYGLSETSPIIACNPLFGTVKDNSCGPHFPGTVLEIRDPENPGHLCATGERGEVLARGPQVMKGYWHKPEETEAVFYDGALRTGDIGYLDEDGYLFLVDRLKDVILCSGFNVYPREIEEAAFQHPDVIEAIAIGIPDPYRGETPKLFVALREGAEMTAETLEEFLSRRINKIEMPTEIEFRESLPKTLIGKLSKKELIEEERAKREGNQE